jgi:putative ABC transport system permease protein
MRSADLIFTVRHAFATNRLRALLTLTGIVIGAGSIVMLASLMHGGEDALVRSSQQANESDMIEIYQSRAPHKDRNKTTRPLSAYDADALGESPFLTGAHVTSAPQRRTKATFGKDELPIGLFGAGVDAPSLYRLEVAQGRGLVDDDLGLRRRVAVVGHDVFVKLLHEPKSLDDVTIAVQGVTFSVVGVLAHKPVLGGGSGTWRWDQRVMIPRTTFLAVLEPDQKRVRSLFVRLKDAGPIADRVVQIADVVESTLLRRHNGVKNFRREGDGGDDQEELILNIVKILLLGTGVVALFVGGTNIMNIMLVTVAERTKEIGIRLAVGAKRRHILWQFLLEAMALALVGGVLGVLAGLAFAFVVAKGLSAAMGYWQFYVEPWSIGLGVGLAVLVGALFGALPAWRAARLDPVVALRAE